MRAETHTHTHTHTYTATRAHTHTHTHLHENTQDQDGAFTTLQNGSLSRQMLDTNSGRFLVDFKCLEMLE